MSQKSYDNTPTLYLIPTPIGNLDDITVRQKNTLELVDVIFSEDTRVTINLLRYLGINKPLISSHDHNENITREKVLNYLKEGKNVGLVSDRGTPGISDPGYVVAKYIIESNFNVVALPGATAFVPALIMSGLDTEHFLFYGFLNSKDSKRDKELEKLRFFQYTMIFYEAPHRILDTLESIQSILGNRNISISREISKKFEEIYRGKISDIKVNLCVKGEFVIVVEGCTSENNYDHLTIIEHVNLYIKQGMNQKDAMKQVAKDRNVSKSEVYNKYHEL